jgi:hypothetical protein
LYLIFAEVHSAALLPFLGEDRDGYRKTTISSVSAGDRSGDRLSILRSLCARPFLSSVSPNSTAAGGKQFVLTVNGSNFRPDSLVSWNGSFRLTTFVSSHQLVAAISAADIAAAGQVLVLVFNPPERGTTSVSGAIGNTSGTPCGGGNSNAVPFTIN